MKIAGRRNHPRLDLAGVEIVILTKMCTDFVELVDGDGVLNEVDPVIERLFPDAYNDPEASAEYAELTRGWLRDERVERVRLCLGELEQAASDTGSIDLSGPEVLDRWLRVLTDLRLALGTRLGVDADFDIDDTDADADGRHIYVWLTAMQDAMVTTVLR